MRARAIPIDLDEATTPRGPLERMERQVEARLAGDGLSAEELARARARQAEVGGRLTSALWELGLVSAVRLRTLCGELLKTPCALPSEVAAAPADALSTLSKEFVTEFQVVPFARNRDTLLVATGEPWRLPLLEGIAQRTGCRVAARFVDEAPLALLLEELYGVTAPARFKTEPEKVTRPPAPATQEAPAEDRGGELMSETAFEAIYQSDGQLPAAGLGASGPAAARPDTSPLPETEHDSPADALPPISASDSSTQPTDFPAPRKGASEPLRLPEKPEPGVSDVLDFGDLWTPESDLDALAAPAAPHAAARPQPSALSQAKAALARCADRDQLAWTVSRFALSLAQRVVLFTLRDDLWLGWSGDGTGIDPARIETLMIPSLADTIFGSVMETGAPFVGALPEHPVHERFAAALGGAPASAALLPVRYRDRIVLGIYLDGGPGGRLPEDLADLTRLTLELPEALERIARVAKAKRRQRQSGR